MKAGIFFTWRVPVSTVELGHDVPILIADRPGFIVKSQPFERTEADPSFTVQPEIYLRIHVGHRKLRTRLRIAEHTVHLRHDCTRAVLLVTVHLPSLLRTTVANRCRGTAALSYRDRRANAHLVARRSASASFPNHGAGRTATGSAG